MCVHTYVHVCVLTCVHLCVHAVHCVYMCVYVCMCVCACVRVCVRACVHACMCGRNEILELWRMYHVGKAGEMVDRGDNTYGGKYVVNPSGGLISKGHPLGATGLAQCAELCWQLRGKADKRQVPGAKVALQHNIGLGGAVVVGLYRLGFPEQGVRNQ